jgi:MSHA biogenesis protein MshM
MYCTYFGFRVAPFRSTPQADPFFEGGQRGATLEALMHALEHEDGVLEVTGERGSGRTTLCRAIQSRLSGRTLCAYLPASRLTPTQAMQAISRELGLPPAGDGDAGARVQAFLRAGMKAGRQVAFLVDDAQHMPSATLEAIRLLTNPDASAQKAARLVLLGTPALDFLLAQHELRQLRGRVTFSARLSPLTPDETSDYLALRVRSAGSMAGSLFPTAVARQIGRAAGGLPLRINLVADRVLMYAFADDTHDIEMRHARPALDGLGLRPPSLLARLRQRHLAPSRPPPPVPAAAR